MPYYSNHNISISQLKSIFFSFSFAKITKFDFPKLKMMLFNLYAFIAHRNFAERARLLELHSSNDGRIISEAISR